MVVVELRRPVNVVSERNRPVGRPLRRSGHGRLVTKAAGNPELPLAAVGTAAGRYLKIDRPGPLPIACVGGPEVDIVERVVTGTGGVGTIGGVKARVPRVGVVVVSDRHGVWIRPAAARACRKAVRAERKGTAVIELKALEGAFPAKDHQIVLNALQRIGGVLLQSALGSEVAIRIVGILKAPWATDKRPAAAVSRVEAVQHQIVLVPRLEIA